MKASHTALGFFNDEGFVSFLLRFKNITFPIFAPVLYKIEKYHECDTLREQAQSIREIVEWFDKRAWQTAEEQEKKSIDRKIQENAWDLYTKLANNLSEDTIELHVAYEPNKVAGLHNQNGRKLTSSDLIPLSSLAFDRNDIKDQ